MHNTAARFFGGFSIMVSISCVLYGMTVLQTFIYYQTYRNDTVLLKCLVMLIFALETAHTVFCVVIMYNYLIKHFGSTNAFERIDWSIGAAVLLKIVLSGIVQTIYVRRIWIVSNHSKTLTSFVAVTVFCRSAIGVVATTSLYHWTSLQDYRRKPTAMAIVGISLGMASLSDIAVALVLSFYVLRGRDEYSKEFRTVANLIIIYAINTGAITAVLSLLSVILYATVHHSFVFLGLTEITAKLYANSFLGSLNSRAYLRRKSSVSASWNVNEIDFQGPLSDPCPIPLTSSIPIEDSVGTVRGTGINGEAQTL